MGCGVEVRSNGVDYEGFLELRKAGVRKVIKWACSFSILIVGVGLGVFFSDCSICERRVDLCLSFVAAAACGLVCTLDHVFLAISKQDLSFFLSGMGSGGAPGSLYPR